MYCRKCGKELDDEAVICPYCGCSTSGGKVNDSKSMGYAVLGFFPPVVGFILWLVWKDEYPLRASSCGKGALVSVIIGVIIPVLFYVAMCSFIIIAPPAPTRFLLPLF